MGWLNRIGAKKGVVGIEVLPGGLAIVAKGCLNTLGNIDIISLLSAEDGQRTLAQELTNFVKKQNISKQPCHLILNPDDYQLLLVESPDVPVPDMREAVRWRVKDLINIPVEKAVIDVFALPNNTNRVAKRMIYVVVTHTDRVQYFISLISQVGLELVSIDIGEMAMRNLSLLLNGDEIERGVGIVRLCGGGGFISLFLRGNLYLTRKFQLNYAGGLLDELPADALSLEMQRSLDYYERQMGLPPPAIIYFCGENISEDKISKELRRSITVPAQFLNIREHECFDENLDSGTVQMCLGAIGAVYRENVVQ